MIFPTLVQQGYFLKPIAGGSAASHHRFCGAHDLRGAQCPNCKKPLLRFLSLDLSQTPFTVETTQTHLHLLYCWRCKVSQRHFSYRILSADEIHILKYQPGESYDDFPYEDYPDYFPAGTIEFEAVREDEQLILEKINNDDINIYHYEDGRYKYLNKPHHQIGGMPKLMQVDYWQNWITTLCPCCGGTMPFFAAIADNCLDSRGFTDNAFVEVLYMFCPTCAVFTAFNICD